MNRDIYESQSKNLLFLYIILSVSISTHSTAHFYLFLNY